MLFLMFLHVSSRLRINQKNSKRGKTQGSRQFSGIYIGFNKQFSAQFYMEKTVFH